VTKKPVRLDIKPSADLRLAIDRWRATQPEIPSRAEAARRLIEIGLRSKPDARS
jgi:hypothetical protein